MKKNILIAFSFTIFLFSCVTKSEHDKLVSQNEIIVQERDKLKQELEELKFGAPNLLADGKKFYEARDFKQSRLKFQMLVDKHPDLAQSIEAKKFLLNIDEEELWYNASNSEDITYSDSYILKYPKGKYIANAVSRLNELKVQNMQKAYEIALNQNSSSAWKKFLEDYPNHEETTAIRKKIIRLEVDEIIGDSKTGQIPSLNQNNSSYSSKSSVSITNNTGCELLVRYSGPDVEMIIIPSNGTKTVFLNSGTYKIAASACGANYAGTESLQGEYSSTFYITTTSY